MIQEYWYITRLHHKVIWDIHHYLNNNDCKINKSIINIRRMVTSCMDYINHTNISTAYLERNNTLNPKETQILAANICTYLKHIWHIDVFVNQPNTRLLDSTHRSTKTSEDNATIWIFQANWNTIKDSHNLTYVQICQNKQTHQFVSSIVVSNVMSLAPKIDEIRHFIFSSNIEVLI